MSKRTRSKEAPVHVGIKPKKLVPVDVSAVRKGKEVTLRVPAVHSQKTNAAPTQAIATQLQDAFDYFNTALFHSKLTPCVLTLERLRKYVGYFRPKQWTVDRKAGALDGTHHQITLDPDRLREKGDKIVLSTLAHEMAHQIVWDATFAETGKFKRPYHCKDWVAVMETIGLRPVIMVKGRPSDKKTGANATHEIEKGGDFDAAADVLLAKGFKLDWLLVPVPEKKEGKGKSKAGAKVAYVCGKCEAKAWGKPELKITCTDCEVPMKANGGGDNAD